MKASVSAWLLMSVLVAGCATTPTAPAPAGATDPAATSAQPAPPSGQQAGGPIAQKPETSTFAGLTVEEYALAEGKNLPPLGGPDGGTLPPLRERWRSIASRVESINKTLAPFGYRVTFESDPNVGHPVYTVYQGDAVAAASVDTLLAPSVSSRGDDFLMLTELAGRTQVLRRKQADAWDLSAHASMPPVFAGDRAVAVVDESGPGRMVPGEFRYSVVSGDERLFSEHFQWSQVDQPIKRLSGWDGHWVLEVAGRVIIDGKDLGAGKGYTEAFGWQLLAGKPFYYAVKDGKTSVVYGDEVLPAQYDAVVHYRCCSPAMYNNGGNDRMAWFFGQRNGRWHYVEIGKYD